MSVIERADDVPVREKGGRGMSYAELVKALRYCKIRQYRSCVDCDLFDTDGCVDKLHDDTAAAIEAIPTLMAESEQDGYRKGYMDGKSEAEAAQPHWVSVEHPPKGDGAFAACCVYDGKIYWFKAIYLDGKWLREMDGLELPVNYWLEIPQPPQEVQE